jgi:competence protein ComEA
MPRRRLEPPPADRIAAVLGIPFAASSAAASSPFAGWVPQRTSLAQVTAVVPTAVVPTAVACPSAVAPAATAQPPEAAPAAIDPTVALSAEAFWASASWAPPASALALPDDGRHRRPGPPKPAILTLPVALRGVRAKPRRLAVLGVLVLLAAVAVVLGIRVAWASSSAKPQLIAAAAHGQPAGLVTRTVPAAFATTGAGGSPAATATGILLVHVVGQVRHPGVVRLSSGSRVLDAVTAAGGAMPSADLNHLNLARVLVDGEQIVVPKPGEIVLGASGTQGGGAGSTAGGSAGSTAGGSAGGLVDLNTADASALDSLPGVGPVLSQRILDWRTAHGRFSSVDELGEVSGIGVKLLAQIGPRVKV